MSEGGRAPAGARRRVLVVAADAGRLLRLRGPLLGAISARGHRLLCLTAHADGADRAGLGALGAEVRTFDMGPPRLQIFADRRSFDAVASAVREWKPYVVLGIGAKPMVMAALGARRVAGTRVVLIASRLAGIESHGATLPSLGVRWMLRRALRSAHVLVVHNRAQEEALRALAVVPERLPLRELPGPGVDLSHFVPTPMPDAAGGLVFAMIAREAPGGGHSDFCEAARRVKGKVPEARFVLALEPGLAAGGSVPAGFQGYADCVEIAAAPADHRDLLARCHVLVHPAHVEGFAQEVAEALACGRPVITADVAGAREAVDERVNGVVVPFGDALALARAMESFLRRPDQLGWMGQASRRKAERRFDADAIGRELLGLMELAAPS